MTIRKKTLLILAILFAVLTASLILLSRIFLLDRFAELEAEDVRVNVRRAASEIDSLRENLEAIAGDWGPWDDTYEFMGNENPEYIARNLGDAVLRNLDLHFFSYWNPDGSHRLTKFVDPYEAAERPAPDGLLNAMETVLPGLDPEAATGGPAGLLRFGDTLFLAAFRPIATSEFTGPIRGVLVAGRMLSPAEIRRISEKTQLEAAIFPLSPAPSTDAGTGEVSIRIVGPDRIAGETTLTDIHGNPVARLAATLPREIFQKGRQTWMYYVLSMLGMLLAFILVTSLLLERNVLAPLSRLHDRVGEIARSEDPDRRLPEPSGQDEVAGLQRRINDVLDALREYRDRQREGETYLQNLLDSIHCGVVVVDAETRTVADLNRAASDMIGMEKDAALGRICHDLFCPTPTGECPILDRGQTLDYAERELLRADGGRIPILKTAHSVERKDRTFLVESFVDISRLKAVQAALEESEEKYRRFFEQDLTGDFITTLAGEIIDCNFAFARIFGYESVAEAKKIDAYSLYPDRRDRDRLLDRVRREKSLEHFDWELRRRDGHPVYAIGNLVGDFDDSGELVTLRGYLFDDTRRILLERNQRRRQKMEAIGTLAGGIAHDFNNILAVILGYTELCLRADPDDPRLGERLNQVLQAGRRAKELVGHILTFSRQREQERKPILPDLIVKEGVQFLRATLPPDIEFETRISDGIGVILADPTQLHQVFLNLCANAGHAMKESGGRLSIALENVEIGSADIADFPDLKPGPHVRLRVSDTGCGMSEEIAERIFEPFFTTKALGEGTGMGLAVVHGIVRSHDGGIRVRSVPDRGSVFEVLFPRIREMEAATPAESAVVPTGSEHILMVDDEHFLVEATSEMLENLGYRVTARTSPLEALAAFRAEPNAFDLLLTDLAMPRMNGEILIRRIREIRPELPVILCTGFSEAGFRERKEMSGIRLFLKKPVLLREMAVTIRRALDGPNGSGTDNSGVAEDEPKA